MKELSQIVKIIDKNKPKKVEVLGNEDADSPHAELYNLLKEGKITTDEEAAAHFYKDSKAVGQSAFRQFKSRFKERLINTLFFLKKDSDEANDLQYGTLDVHKEWAAINILYTKGGFKLAAKLAEDLLPDAIKYEVTEIVIYIADRLRQGYGTQIADQNRYVELKKLQEEYMELWRLEILARETFHNIRMDYIKSSTVQTHSIEKAQAGWAMLQPYLEKKPSYQFITYAYSVALAQYGNSPEDLQRIIALCDEAIAVLSQKAFNPTRQIATFMNQKIACYAQLKEQTAGENVAKQVLSLQTEGSFSWFKTLEHQVLLAFNTKEYAKAFAIWQEAQSHKSYKSLDLQHYEIWQLFGAYLYFLAVSGKIEAQTMKETNFKARKFLNDIPTFNTDKEGMNVPSLIVQIAILIAEKKHDTIPDRLEALNKYWRRYIKKIDTPYRGYCFIKMLQELPKGNYKRISIEARTKTMLKELMAVPPDTEVKDFRSEVIPLEDLWAILLTLM
jgi:hypothetical protein